MHIKYTDRGFGRTEFEDVNGHECSIQESSSATGAKLWLGINEVEVIDYAGTPRVIDLKTLGENVQARGRMHLDQDMVRDMLPMLHCFVETGDLSVVHTTKEGDATAHPEWPHWLAWYGHNYTTVIPMRNNYPDNLEQALSWETWKAQHDRLGDHGSREIPDLNREWKVSKGCDCGCNTPNFTKPMDALRSLMRRMNSAGVAHAVSSGYAHDIMKILKRWDMVDQGEMPEWTTFATAKPAPGEPFILRHADSSDIGIGYYVEEDAAEWTDDVEFISFSALNALPVNQV